MRVALAATHHDPDGRMFDQTARMLPLLRETYGHIAVFATPATDPAALEILRSAGAAVYTGAATLPTGHLHLGLWRRSAVEASLRSGHDVPFLHFCDLDRVLHWAEFFPAELRTVVAEIPRHDLTVLGRTARAFATHPRAQRDTEALANHTFALACGLPWDVMAAARGLSRRAAEALVEGCRDDTVGSDCAWPLYIRRRDGMTLGYRETEGLEFETLDRLADEIAALGSREAWIARFDGDPRQWAYRLALAQAEVDSAIAYA